MAHIDEKDRKMLPDPDPAPPAPPKQRYFQPTDLILLIATVDRYTAQAKQFNGEIHRELVEARKHLVEAAREHCYLEKLAETAGGSQEYVRRNQD